VVPEVHAVRPAAAVAAFNPALDFTTLDTNPARGPMQDLLSNDPELARAASPHYQADEAAAPTLLVHGTSDRQLPFSQSLAFMRRLQELGVRAELYTAEGMDHGFWNGQPHFEAALSRMHHFFGEVLGADAA
jgi:dipeptidyl aminopeptidase/acylaminoacyl peptidase